MIINNVCCNVGRVNSSLFVFRIIVGSLCAQIFMKMDKHFIAKIGNFHYIFWTNQFFKILFTQPKFLRSNHFSKSDNFSDIPSDMFPTPKFVACFRQNYGLRITSLQCNKLIFKDRLFIFFNVGYVIVNDQKLRDLQISLLKWTLLGVFLN